MRQLPSSPTVSAGTGWPGTNRMKPIWVSPVRTLTKSCGSPVGMGRSGVCFRPLQDGVGEGHAMLFQLRHAVRENAGRQEVADDALLVIEPVVAALEDVLNAVLL